MHLDLNFSAEFQNLLVSNTPAAAYLVPFDPSMGPPQFLSLSPLFVGLAHRNSFIDIHHFPDVCQPRLLANLSIEAGLLDFTMCFTLP